MKKYIKIGKRLVGFDKEPLVVAEIGINHNGSLDLAISIADAAIKSGAEIIKHQTHVIDDEMANYAKKVVPGNSKKSIYEIIKETSLSEKSEQKLMQHIKSKKKFFLVLRFQEKLLTDWRNLMCLSTKSDRGSVIIITLLNMYVKKKPIILSTGMNSLKSIEPAVKIIRKYKLPYALLHCTNIYPTPHKLVRLNAMLQLKQKFKDAIIGYQIIVKLFIPA